MNADPRLRTAALLLALCAVAGRPGLARQSATPAAPAAQVPAAAPRLIVDTPADNTPISGPSIMSAHVLPASQRVERMTFLLDGRPVCVLEQPPFQCEWDVGPGVREHQIRVVAQLPGQPALRRTIRTSGSEYVEAADVEAVQVTVTVTDAAGRFVRNLARNAFRVFENGVEQGIGHFMASNIPLELVVAVDSSGSMAGAMPQARQAVKKFLTALRSQDRVTLLAFNDQYYTIARPTADLAFRLKAVDRLAAWGGTSLYQVIIGALELQGRQTGRRAVVMFTDGEDRNSLVPMAAAERRLETSDSLLYLVGLGQGVKVPALRQILEKFARLSGGRTFFADDAEQLDEPFSHIVDELSNQYLLGYQPKNDKKDGTWRAISVKLNNPEYLVRAKEGYRARSAGDAQ